MPSLLPVPGVVRLSFRGTANGVGCVNVFHVKCGDDALAIGSITTILTTVRTAYQSHFVPRLGSVWSGDTAVATDLSSIIGASVEQPLGGTPSAPGNIVPQSAACCISWKISRRYRGGHPRTYLGPVPATALENQTTFTSAYLALVQTAADNFFAACNGITTPDGTTGLVAVHRYFNKVELNPPVTSLITSSGVDSRIDTMRRRLGPDR